jgi:hypothetical protein
MVDIARPPGSSGFVNSGGRRVHDNEDGSGTEAFYLGENDRTLRAYWTDEPSYARQTTFLMLFAAIAGVGLSMVLRSLGRFITIALQRAE